MNFVFASRQIGRSALTGPNTRLPVVSLRPAKELVQRDTENRIIRKAVYATLLIFTPMIIILRPEILAVIPSPSDIISQNPALLHPGDAIADYIFEKVRQYLIRKLLDAALYSMGEGFLGLSVFLLAIWGYPPAHNSALTVAFHKIRHQRMGNIKAIEATVEAEMPGRTMIGLGGMKLLFTGLPPMVDENWLFRECSRFGPVINVYICRDTGQRRCNGVGWATFLRYEDTQTAFTVLTDMIVGTKRLKPIKWAYHHAQAVNNEDKPYVVENGWTRKERLGYSALSLGSVGLHTGQGNQ